MSPINNNFSPFDNALMQERSRQIIEQLQRMRIQVPTVHNSISYAVNEPLQQPQPEPVDTNQNSAPPAA